MRFQQLIEPDLDIGHRARLRARIGLFALVPQPDADHRRLAQVEDDVAVPGAAPLADRDDQVGLGGQLLLQRRAVVEGELAGRERMGVGNAARRVAGEDDRRLEQLGQLGQFLMREARLDALAGPDDRPLALTNAMTSAR